MIREWRATLLGNGVSVSTAAKAYRFLRAVLMTAAEEDKILPRNPCRVRGAGDEHAPERPVLTVMQVFELAEWVGRRPQACRADLPEHQAHGADRRITDAIDVQAEHGKGDDEDGAAGTLVPAG